MFIFEGQKINKFKDVRIPKKREYFNTGRFIADKGQYGGEKAFNPNGVRKDEALEELDKDITTQEEKGDQ